MSTPTSDVRSRKRRIWDLSDAYATKHEADRTGRHDALTVAWQEGYRAAMRDARRALAEADTMNSDTPIRLFLRALR